MRTVLFAGPTASRMDLSPWPFLERRGPVKHGDLLRAELASGDTVLLVDGVYQHYPPIRFKEIIVMLRRGVVVLGAASMGALRAVELEPLGMIGVGKVHAWYAAGDIDADADVALSHAEADDDYRPLTVPIVSIKHAAAMLSPAITTALANRVLEHARSLAFSRRSLRALHAASEHDTDLHDAVRAVCAYLSADAAHDVKRGDLLELLHRVDRGALPAARRPPADCPVSAWEQQWLLEHTPVPGSATTWGEVLRFCQLFLPDWRERHRRWVLDQIRDSNLALCVNETVGDQGLWPDSPEARHALLTDLDLDRAAGDEDVRDRMLARTFRAGPGKFVYRRFPTEVFESAELDELIELTTRARAASTLAEERHAHFSATQLAAEEVTQLFAMLWDEMWSTWSWVDRGFTSEDDFLHAARPLFVAARSVLAARRPLESAPDEVVTAP